MGEITEYSGNLTHKANYAYAGDQSNPVYGPSDAGANHPVNTPYKSWFWIYRSTLDDSISLNIVSGSAAAGYPNDGGTLRVEIEFSGSFSGTPTYIAPAYIQGNEPGEMKVDPANSNRFIPDNPNSGGWVWTEAYDDGGVFGGIIPVATSPAPPAIPEPLTLLCVSGGLVCLTGYVRRRRAA